MKKFQKSWGWYRGNGYLVDYAKEFCYAKTIGGVGTHKIYAETIRNDGDIIKMIINLTENI